MCDFGTFGVLMGCLGLFVIVKSLTAAAQNKNVQEGAKFGFWWWLNS